MTQKAHVSPALQLECVSCLDICRHRRILAGWLTETHQRIHGGLACLTARPGWLSDPSVTAASGLSQLLSDLSSLSQSLSRSEVKRALSQKTPGRITPATVNKVTQLIWEGWNGMKAVERRALGPDWGEGRWDGGGGGVEVFCCLVCRKCSSPVLFATVGTCFL